MEGLSSKEAEKRLKKYGLNSIERTKKTSLIKMFLDEFTSPLTLILIAAAIISLLIGYLPGQTADITDSALILIIVLASGIAGFVQDYKAEKTIENLRKMAAPKAKVIRDGKIKEIEASEVVPGDVVIVEAGDIIPADAKIIDVFKLSVNESMLTGESKDVSKKKGDLIYMNTFVRAGKAKAIVKATGMKTKIGKIAKKLSEIEEEKTTFDKEIEDFSKKVAIMITGLIGILFVISLFKYDFYMSFLTAISLAVAAIPEGLPAVVVLTLAVAAKEMSKRNALIRKLSVTESIGAVDVICSDKTGTITKNQMTVVKVYDGKEREPKNIENKELMLCSALCNNVEYSEGKYLGEQTEIAIRKVADENKYIREELEKEWKRIDEVPFNSERKMMSTVYKHKGKYYVFSKGAPEILINKCSYILDGKKRRKLTVKDKQKILKKTEEYGKKALRVIGFAYKEEKERIKEIEEGLIWIGLEGMIDPPKEGVKESIAKCKTAGIDVMMLTGDNAITAQAIAKEVGIETKGVLTGEEINKLDAEKLREKIDKGIRVFARISPFDKLKILEALKKDKRVAMTGDGVNDSLALKDANVGIAMGLRGTEVAKQASDIILLDDNFSTIVNAIEEGRRVFDNIRKFVNYLFVSNFAEVAVLFIATLFMSLKEPIMLPVQLLWINLLTDGMPALALGVDPAKKDIMKEKPRKKNEQIINKNLWAKIFAIGTEKTIMLLLTFLVLLPFGEVQARTALFTGFILYEFVRLGTIRATDKLGLLENKWLVLAVVVSLLMQFFIVYFQPIAKLFHIEALNLVSLAVLAVGTILGYLLGLVLTMWINKNVRD